MEKQKNVSPNGGRPDPTYNVSELVNAAVQRLDDLAEVRYNCLKDEIRLNKEIMNIHISYGKELRLADEKLSLAESKRIDAIRAVDAGAVAIDSEKQKSQANVLASQLTASADNLRTLVDTRAASLALQNQQQFSGLNERVLGLEKGANEGVGKGRVTDPLMDKLFLKLDSLGESRAGSKGSSDLVSKVIPWLIAAAGLIYAITK